MIQRPRRLRKNPTIREMIAETRLSKDMFIYPFFVVHGKGINHPIEAMPGVSHFSIDELLKELETLVKAGLNKVLLFGVGEEKTVDASSSHSHNSIVPQAVRAIKEDRKSTRLNSSHPRLSRMPSSA